MFLVPFDRLSWFGEFTLYRPAKGTNTYAPRLRGEITQAANGQSLVRVTMSVRPVAVAILVGFFAFMEYQIWKAGDNAFIAPLVLVVFHVALYIVGYRPEAVRARQILEGAHGAGLLLGLARDTHVHCLR